MSTAMLRDKRPARFAGTLARARSSQSVKRVRLGVNIDHIATVRQARRGSMPDPVEAALVCERAGANSIVCHLREDRRHIQDGDVKRLKASLSARLNLEMSIARDIVDVAFSLKPFQVTLVPERRQELTTEGGLDVVRWRSRLARLVSEFTASGIGVSLFVDPIKSQLQAAKDVGVSIVELHTGHYANASSAKMRVRELEAIRNAAYQARKLGLVVAAGHGLDYQNVSGVAELFGIEEVNIGFSIIARALWVGLHQAVKDMSDLLKAVPTSLFPREG